MSDLEEEFVPEDEAEEGPGLVKKLREKLKKAVEEKQEYLEGWQRSRADFANYKREEAGMRQENEVRTKANLVEAMLPALDALELAIKHETSPTLEMIQKQFKDVLKRMGVEVFGEVGEAFNPHAHEALAQQGDEQVVTSVERSGYKVGDMVVRPAQVILK